MHPCKVSQTAIDTKIRTGRKNVVPPNVSGAGAGARRVFPFRLRGQAIGVAGLRAQPRRIHLGLVPTDVDHRPHTPTPALIFGPIDPGLGAGKAIVVRKGHFIPAHGQAPIEADRAQRPFIALVVAVVGRRSHAEITRRQHHHLGPLAAVFERVAKDLGGGRGGRRQRGGRPLARGRALANRVGRRDHKVIGTAVGQVGHGVCRAGNIRYARHVGARGEVADPGQAGCGVIQGVGAGAADFVPGGRDPGVARVETQAGGRGRRLADGGGGGLAGDRAFANGVAGREHKVIRRGVAESGDRVRGAAEIRHPHDPFACGEFGDRDPVQAGFGIIQGVSAGMIVQRPGGRHLGVAGDEAHGRRVWRVRGRLWGDFDLVRGRALAGRVFGRDHKVVRLPIAQPGNRVRGAAKTGHPRAARQAAVDGRGRGVHPGKTLPGVTLPGVVQGVAAGVRHLGPGGRRPRVTHDEAQIARRGQRRGGGVRPGGCLAGGRALAAGVGGRYGKKVAPVVGQCGDGVRQAGEIGHPRDAGRGELCRGEAAQIGDISQAGLGIVQGVRAGAGAGRPDCPHLCVARAEAQAAGHRRRAAGGLRSDRRLGGWRALAGGVAGRDHNIVGDVVAEFGERVRRAGEIGRPGYPLPCGEFGERDPGQAGLGVVEGVAAGAAHPGPACRGLGVAPTEAQVGRRGQRGAGRRAEAPAHRRGRRRVQGRIRKSRLLPGGRASPFVAVLDDAPVGRRRVGRHAPRAKGRKADQRRVAVGHGRTAQRVVQGRPRRRAETGAEVVGKIPVAHAQVVIGRRHPGADPAVGRGRAHVGIADAQHAALVRGRVAAKADHVGGFGQHDAGAQAWRPARGGRRRRQRAVHRAVRCQ